jgi:hypothetical protein
MSKSQTKDENATLSLEAIQANLSNISIARAKLALASGTAAGILGLESFSGFGFYILCSAGLSVLLLIKVGFAPRKYFPSSEMVWTFDVLGNLSSYILFWVLAYGVVHVYE